eukprot:CAMPEP_0117513906 /NCGR_PEP_ID=MMETSP0784-20121206/29795_1 /TAXON_ID=39447 /ORGANISM="" /LENGTH=276 /DNA_ID=CAMNT_0005309685 /DNA_START=43 /DNA_END=873 /DNA_ORIENTATION=+
MPAKVADIADDGDASSKDAPDERNASLKSAQDILHACPAAEETRIGALDESVVALCQSPGIFSIIWARRGSCWEEMLVMLICLQIQFFVPLYICVRHPDSRDEPGDSSLEIKFAAFGLSLYLISTFTGTLDRIYAMTVLITSIEGWRWILIFGAVTLYASVFLTAYSTFALFRQAPGIQDLLLNCVALNFIVEVDISLVSLLKCSGLGNVDVALSRLAKLADAWPDTDARDNMRTYLVMPMKARALHSPATFGIGVLNQVCVTLLIGNAIWLAVFI